MHELADDEQPRIRLERRALRRIVTIHGLDEPDGADLLEIGRLETATLKSPGRAPAKIPVVRDETLAPNRTPKRRCVEPKSHTLNPPLLTVIYHVH
jgi:hypothetical protein